MGFSRSTADKGEPPELSSLPLCLLCCSLTSHQTRKKSRALACPETEQQNKESSELWVSLVNVEDFPDLGLERSAARLGITQQHGVVLVEEDYVVREVEWRGRRGISRCFLSLFSSHSLSQLHIPPTIKRTGIVNIGVAGAKRALEDDGLLGLPDLEHRHACNR